MGMVLPSLYYQYNTNNVGGGVNVGNGGDGGSSTHSTMAKLEEDMDVMSQDHCGGQEGAFPITPCPPPG